MSDAYLLLEDGTRFDGARLRPRGRGHRRGRLQHRDDRLPGVGHRPLLRGPDHRLHLPADRQLRRLARRRWSPTASTPAASSCATPRTARTSPPPRAAGSTGSATAACPAISGVDTRALVRHIRDRGAMRGGIFPAETPEAEARERVAAEPSMDGADLARTVTPPEPVRFEGDGPHVVGIDTGIKMSIVRQLRERGCQADPAALHHLRRGGPRRGPRPRLPRQRPRRPGGARLRRRHRPRAGRQEARLRHLPRPPAALPRGRPRDLQAALRPPRRQPPGQGPGDGADRHHLPEPRLRGRRARAASRGSRATSRCAGRPTSASPSSPTSTSTTARSRAWSCATSPAPPSSTTPRPAPARTTPATSSTASWSSRLMPTRDDIEKILLIGSGPIVIGQAAEFDYSGVQACKVLLEEGYEVVLVNSNPATIMTDPEFATATYVEPLLPGPVTQDHREGAPRRAAADARRPDGAQPGDGAARGRHPGALRGRADRRRRTRRSAAPRTARSSARR